MTSNDIKAEPPVQQDAELTAKTFDNPEEAPLNGASSIAQLVMQQRSIHSGPLPAPDDLDYYDKICPGAADRLIALVEKEQAQRFKDRDSFWGDMKLRRYLTFAHAVIIAGVAALSVWLEFPLAAGFIMALAIAGAYINRDPIKKDKKQVPPPPDSQKDEK